MARLPRVTQSIFAGSASNNGVFGSAAAGTPATSNDISVIMAATAWTNGWLSAVLGASKFPALEDFQGVNYVHSQQIAYLLQQGLPEYDAGTTYYKNNICAAAGTYQLYGSKTDNNTGNALTDTTKWQALMDISQGPAFTSLSRQLAAAWASNTSATISADFVVLSNSAGFAYKANSVSLTINTGTSGANGLDTGSIAANTWYYGYVIYNPTTQTVAGLISTSASAPTLPSGYTYSALVTAMRTDGSNNLIGFKQNGRMWQYVVGSNLSALRTIISGVQGSVGTPTYVSAAMAAFAPLSIISSVMLQLQMASTGATDTMIVSPSSNYGPVPSASNPGYIAFNGVASGVNGVWPFSMILEDSNIYYAGDNVSCAVRAIGFNLNI